MADADKTLQILIQLGVIGAPDVKAANDLLKETGGAAADLSKEMGVVNVTEGDVEKATGKMSDKVDDAGKKVEEAGGKAGSSMEKHRTLYRVMSQLDQISPGLGEAVHLLADSYMAAGEGAEAGATGVAAFTTALDEMLMSLGPLVIAFLSIQAVMTYWEMYKSHVAGAAAAHAEAMESIVKSTKAALAAVQELDAAMHPKQHNTAEKDEESLKQQQQNLENAYNRQKALNDTNKAQELQGAGSPAEKEAIEKRYEVLDAALNDWKAKQNAAIEGSMLNTMDSQLAALKAVEDRLIEKSKVEYRLRDTPEGKARYDQTVVQSQKAAAEAAAIREKRDDLAGQQSTDAGNANFNAETNRQVFGKQGIDYQAPPAGYDMPAPDRGADDAAGKFATGKSIADLAEQGGKVSDSQQQFLVVLEQSITGHAQTFASAVGLIEAQSANSKTMAALLEIHRGQIEAVHGRLTTLEGQMKNTQFNHY